ncbi:MAG TPA: hypothetical protein PKC43_12455 [Phycisphaerales bacterium]|nr:hypothetical protein [Phycisphaerales bacterium]HMP38244.1 hypothetical protein [Phycisphaerales bacterium]
MRGAAPDRGAGARPDRDDQVNQAGQISQPGQLDQLDQISQPGQLDQINRAMAGELSPSPSDRGASPPAEATPGAGERWIDVAHRDVRFRLVAPASSEALIDEVAFNADERLPYWADLWPASVALMRWVLDASAPELGFDLPLPRNPDDSRRRLLGRTRGAGEPHATEAGSTGEGECAVQACAAQTSGAAPTAIELGCGLGLVSLALLRRGLRVVATDYEPAALEHVVRSAAATGLLGPEGEGVSGAAAPGSGARAVLRTMLLDWRSEGAYPAADLVLGADLLYEERAVEPLATLIARLLAPGGRAIIADPGRRWFRAFEGAMRTRGFEALVLADRIEPGTAPGASPSSVQIVAFSRRDGPGGCARKRG